MLRSESATTNIHSVMCSLLSQLLRMCLKSALNLQAQNVCKETSQNYTKLMFSCAIQDLSTQTGDGTRQFDSVPLCSLASTCEIAPCLATAQELRQHVFVWGLCASARAAEWLMPRFSSCTHSEQSKGMQQLSAQKFLMLSTVSTTEIYGLCILGCSCAASKVKNSGLALHIALGSHGKVFTTSSWLPAILSFWYLSLHKP